MTADLVEFLRARLDEDEQTARGTGKPPAWHQGPGDDPEWSDEEMVLMWPPEFHTPYEQDKHWRGLSVDGPGLAAHIARHDPARVLAEVDAKRRLLAMHEEAIRVEQFVLTEALRAFAAAYADHPDYREEWKP